MSSHETNMNSGQYHEKITSMLQSLHESERRRLELERELFVYCRSDKRILQLKCSKLRSYLKEISHREERAKSRNLELRREAERLENSLKNYQPARDLQQMKVKVKQRQDMGFTEPSNTPPELSVMGQQTKDSLRTSSGHRLHHSPDSSLQIHEPLSKSFLKTFRDGLEDSVRNQTCLSDDISSLNDPPHGSNMRDEHKRTTPEHQNVNATPLISRNVPSLSNEHDPLPPVTLTATEMKRSPCYSGPMGAENPIVENMDSKESTTQPPEKEKVRDLIQESTTDTKVLISPESCESSLASEENLSGNKSSALSISLTQSELEEDLPESETADQHDVKKEMDSLYLHSPKSSLHSDQSDTSMEGVVMDSLSQKGLYKLLDTIEGQRHLEQSRVYINPSIDTKERHRLIGLCNRGGDLNGEDPKACGAVVLHELQRLSWCTVKGCLLPPDLVNTRMSYTTAEEISACLPPDAAQLWDRWFKHALLLKERSVLSTEHLVQLFTPLLLERHATYGHQAKVLLRTLLSRSSEECPSAEDESDVSAVGPEPLSASGAVRPLQNQYSPEQQSSEEDSQDESPVESVPIRESRAYQMLKLSAMQKRTVNFQEEAEDMKEDLLGINDDHEEDFGWAKRSLNQDPYPRMEELNSKVSSALQSKAFWGESDDSNSEIEAALRPQPFSTNNVDTDDFYNE